MMFITDTKEYKDIANIVRKWLNIRDKSEGDEKNGCVNHLMKINLFHVM